MDNVPDWYTNPGLLVGSRVSVLCQIQDEDHTEWFDGRVASFDSQTNKHRIMYEGGNEDDLINLINSDFKIFMPTGRICQWMYWF